MCLTQMCTLYFLYRIANRQLQLTNHVCRWQCTTIDLQYKLTLIFILVCGFLLEHVCWQFVFGHGSLRVQEQGVDLTPPILGAHFFFEQKLCSCAKFQ